MQIIRVIYQGIMLPPLQLESLLRTDTFVCRIDQCTVMLSSGAEEPRGPSGLVQLFPVCRVHSERTNHRCDRTVPKY